MAYAQTILFTYSIQVYALVNEMRVVFTHGKINRDTARPGEAEKRRLRDFRVHSLSDVQSWETGRYYTR